MLNHQLLAPSLPARHRRVDGVALDGVAARLGRRARAAGASSEAPVRLAVLFSGNGFHSKEWWAKGEGKAMELGKVLAPLDDFREKLLFIRGLYNAEALKGNIHSSQTGNLLSGAPLASGRRDPFRHELRPVARPAARTVDQGAQPGAGCEKSNPSVHKNYSMLYSSHISWSSPTTPTPLELYPALAFDRLFKDEVEQGRQERARRGARRRPRLPPPGQHCRPAQARRISRLGARGRAADRAGRQDRASSKAGGPRSTSPNMPRPADGIPQDIAEHMRLMCDILVLASRPTRRASARSS